MSKPKKKGILDRIRIFLFGKNEKDLIPPEWVTPDSKPPDPELGKKETKPLKVPKLALPEAARELVDEFNTDKEKIKIPGLRKGKRVVAFLLLLISLGGVYGSVVSRSPPFMVLLSCNSIITLDYLWKTQPRRKKKYMVVEE